MSSSHEKKATTEWLKNRSMLLKHDALVQRFSASNEQWNQAFGLSRPHDFLRQGSVWFSSYADSLVGNESDRALDVLADPTFHQHLSEIGIQAIHTGPMKLAGSLIQGGYGRSVDGHFDRVESRIDTQYGDESLYQDFVKVASDHGIQVIGDLIPGHTGKGADFHLALKNEAEFPGLYTLIEVKQSDWHLLPMVPADQDSINLSLEELGVLRQAGYSLLQQQDVEIFLSPGVKESSWSATSEVLGSDGITRRWVYLHIFKQGQPTLNWSDPSFSAHRLLIADMLHSIKILGVAGLRLDATMFLGIEKQLVGEKNWLSGHPLSTLVTDMIGMMTRKFGGFTFQELNSDLATISRSLHCGPDFSYDFSTRPASLYAVALADAGPLRVVMREMLVHEVQPYTLVHGLQNHDELMLEASHFKVNGEQWFEWEHGREQGHSLFERLHLETTRAVTGEQASYNLPFAMGPGVCSTMAGFIAARLFIEDLQQITPDQLQSIKQLHLVAAAFNALQGGVFMISGWDLVGALPLSTCDVGSLLEDGDYRWINRGGYELTEVSPGNQQSVSGLPIAGALYGTIASQLGDPGSFVSRLKEMLHYRQQLKLERSILVSVPNMSDQALFTMIHRLDREGRHEQWAVVAMNFSQRQLSQLVECPPLAISSQLVWSSLSGASVKTSESIDDALSLTLGPLEVKLLLLNSV